MSLPPNSIGEILRRRPATRPLAFTSRASIEVIADNREDELEEWLKGNCRGRFAGNIYPTLVDKARVSGPFAPMVFQYVTRMMMAVEFEDKDDALRFKLTFGGE